MAVKAKANPLPDKSTENSDDRILLYKDSPRQLHSFFSQDARYYCRRNGRLSLDPTNL